MTGGARNRRRYCVVMGAAVVPLVAAAEVGTVWLAPVAALFTAGPWLVAAAVRRPWSIAATVLLSWFFVVAAAVLPSEDGAGRAIGWASATIATYGVAAVAGVLHLVTRGRADPA